MSYDPSAISRLASSATGNRDPRVAWKIGRTLLTADIFFLVELTSTGSWIILASEHDLPGLDTRATIH